MFNALSQPQFPKTQGFHHDVQAGQKQALDNVCPRILLGRRTPRTPQGSIARRVGAQLPKQREV